MNEKFGNASHTKAVEVTNAINDIIYEVGLRCIGSGGELKNRFEIAIVGYGKQEDAVQSGWEGQLSGKWVVSIKNIFEFPLGQDNDKPIWIKPYSVSNTPMTKAFENAKTPNKVAVMQLLRQLAEARLLLKEAVLYYSPKEEEMPDGDFVPFFETLGVGKVVFPKVEVLAEMELELLTIALHFLFGKGFHSEHFVEWDLVRQYREFVAHWSRWGKVDDSVDYLLFKMQPQEETIFDRVRKPSKYKSYSDYIMAGLPKSEEGGDELPF